MQSEWIAASERLPEFDKLVLVVDVNGRTWIAARSDYNEEGWLWSRSYGVDFTDGKFETDDLEDDDIEAVYWCDFFSTVPPLPREEVTNG